MLMTCRHSRHITKRQVSSAGVLLEAFGPVPGCPSFILHICVPTGFSDLLVVRKARTALGFHNNLLSLTLGCQSPVHSSPVLHLDQADKKPIVLDCCSRRKPAERSACESRGVHIPL